MSTFERSLFVHFAIINKLNYIRLWSVLRLSTNQHKLLADQRTIYEYQTNPNTSATIVLCR